MADDKVRVVVDGEGPDGGLGTKLISAPSNSNKSKESQTKLAIKPKKYEKIVQGSIEKKKKSLGGKFLELFDIGDIHSVTSYVIKEVVVPNIKTLLTEVAFGSWNMLMYKDPKGNAPKKPSPYGRIDYTGCFSRQTPVVHSRVEGDVRTRYAVEDILFDHKADAMDVLSTLINILNQYDVVTYLEYHQLVGVEPNSSDPKWGWYNLSSASVKQYRNKYYIDLPPAKYIDKE